ncbi:adenine deaminase [Sporomusaceae bacterium BoRhaA]|uniref:adenine deaminase n=1 Tax=Pelorhabdus rhamnosifermentans TaxID=2772457 RepID=UPI001C062217|nr:adenine deaminase C-terminal domain-containing protein [Pelorhabdus rhamnosifermentans]MBU2699410.1 adenine deaminase [Pelorhabdus rhamnosifermentans]
MKIDLLLKNAQFFNAYLKKFVHSDLAILNGKFFYIGTEETSELEATATIELQGKYVIPGLIDSHMHIESSMAAPRTFTQALVKNGVTTIVAEPHEIANVFGLEGIKALMAAAQDCPVDVRIAIPSSVPSTNSMLETSGSEINCSELAEMLQMDGVICLGEVMNYVDVLNQPDSKSNQFIRYVKETKGHFPIEGHCPRLLGLPLARFLFAGVTSDHTEQSLQGIKERIANGMFVEIQEKSLKREIIDYLVTNELYEHFALVTDDTMPDVLMKRGHLNYLVKKAVELGLKSELAIYAATFTPARRMGLVDRGSIAPGKVADFVILEDLQTLAIHQTFKNGREVFNSEKKQAAEEVDVSFPTHFYHSVHLPLLTADCFNIKTNQKDGRVTCRVLYVSEGTTFTKEKIVSLPVRNYLIDWENSSYCLAVILERHGKDGNRGYALVGGDALKAGAVATTYAHDHHNLLVLGRNKQDMLFAANQVITKQGGYYVAHKGKIIAKTDLPIAGILSDQPLAVLSAEVNEVKNALAQLGYRHDNIIMSISTLSLTVSPELKLTDKGLVNVNQQRLVPLVIGKTMDASPSLS